MPYKHSFTACRFMKKHLCVMLFLLCHCLCTAKTPLEDYTFDYLEDYIDNHKNTEVLYFDYLKAYRNKAQKTGDLDQLFYIESKYVVHSKTFAERLQHAQAFLKLAKQQNNQRYIGLAYNELALVYHIERDWEQSLRYELQAEAVLAQTDDLYSLNKSRYGIGSIYYLLGNYEKALQIFKQTTAYYESRKSYNALNGYINSVQFQIKCYCQLDNYAKANHLLDTLFGVINHLKPYDKEHKDAYLSLLKGQSLYAQKQYNEALAVLQKAVAPIKANDDFANEHLAYLYIAKNLWATGKQEEAVGYFKKVDTLFTEKGYTDPFLQETYDALIAYYKDAGAVSQQLFYTEQALAAKSQLQKEYKNLNTTLHNRYETQTLEASRADLQKQLKAQANIYYFIWGAGVVAVAGVLFYLLYYRKKRKTMHKEALALIDDAQTTVQMPENIANTEVAPEEGVTVMEENTEHTTEVAPETALTLTEQNTESITEVATEVLEDTAVQVPEVEVTEALPQPAKKILSKEKLLELTEKLLDFEQQQGFLDKDVTLATLAKTMNTNTRYLSKAVNSVKKQSFANYLNNLRIDYAVQQLKEDEATRKLTVPALAEMFGFNNTRSFSDAFEKVTDMKPMSYISQIKKAQRNKEVIR